MSQFKFVGAGKSENQHVVCFQNKFHMAEHSCCSKNKEEDIASIKIIKNLSKIKTPFIWIRKGQKHAQPN